MLSRTILLSSSPVDLSWANQLFALRVVVSVLAATAIAFWLQVREPQWAGLTACLVIQPTAGAVLAKSVYRVLGTIIGALFGLFALSLYAEAPIPFVALMVLWLALSVYGGARLRNFAAYGALLAGYSALLVGFDGIASPAQAWMIATERSVAILIGIGCSTAVTLTLAPVYAGDLLAQSLRRTFSGLADYASKTLDAATPVLLFSATRRRMITDVARFEVLRSYAAFEDQEKRARQDALSRVVREFLGVLSTTRSLYFRLGGIRQEAFASALDPTMAILEEVGVILAAVSTETGFSIDSQKIHRDLLGARQRLLVAENELMAGAGSAPFDELTNAVLVLSQTTDMVRRLSMVMAAESGAFRRGRGLARRIRTTPLLSTEPALQAVRAGLALLLVIIFWNATGWSAGFSAVSGIAIVIFFLVNQDGPGKIAWPYVRGVALGSLAAYLAMLYVLPHLEGFTAFAIFLAVILFPVGLMMGTPRFAFFAVGFAAFFIVGVATANQFNPDPTLYVNDTAALLLGLAAFLIASAGILPVSPRLLRRQAWRQALRAMASTAQGVRMDRLAEQDVLAALSELLPRLDLNGQVDDAILRGCLGAAATCLEFGRIQRWCLDPGVPAEIVVIVRPWLQTMGKLYEDLYTARTPSAELLARTEVNTRDLYNVLAGTPIAPGSSQGQPIIYIAASLRFIIDRFDSDRIFLQHKAAMDPEDPKS